MIRSATLLRGVAKTPALRVLVQNLLVPIDAPGRGVLRQLGGTSLCCEPAFPKVKDDHTGIHQRHAMRGGLITEVGVHVNPGHAKHFVESAQRAEAEAIEQQKVTGSVGQKRWLQNIDRRPVAWVG